MTVLNDFSTYLAQAHGCTISRNRNAADPSRSLLITRVNAAALNTRMDEAIGALAHPLKRVPVALVLFDVPEHAPQADIRRLASAIANVPPSFFGKAPAPCRGCLALFDRSEQAVTSLAPPSSFRVLAVVPSYNEEDIIEQTLRYLIDEGVEVYLLDNWSTDGTVERALPLSGSGLVAIERFPQGPTTTYNLTALLRRVEEIAEKANWADWVMLHDADERRRSPWPGVPLRSALWRVDQSGFSCVDHVTLNFWPVNDRFDPKACELEQYFSYFEFSSHPGHFHQRRAWNRRSGPVALADSAGHDVRFASRRVYPYKFLLKHYPVRSQAHGERKVRHERVARWNPEERARGWHRQYDAGAEIFLRRAEDLIRFDDRTFWDRYLVERLSGAGIFLRPPHWATAPRW